MGSRQWEQQPVESVQKMRFQPPSRSLKKLIAQHIKRKREPPPEGMQVVSTRITKTGVSSSGAKSELFFKRGNCQECGKKQMAREFKTSQNEFFTM